MTTYSQGDIVIVPCPFTDQSGTKQRPAVVMSGTAHNQSRADIILAPITSQLRGAVDSLAVTDWQAAGLLRPSVVKPILSTFDARLVRRRLGALSAADRAQVRAFFARVLDLL